VEKRTERRRRFPFFATPRPLVFAHRGGSALAPENTIEAFAQGVELGADGLELDVHLSRDGVVVVHHDFTLDRTTDLAGPLSHRTADELARADAGYHFENPRAGGRASFRGCGIGIPSLADVLRRFPDVRLIIEMKSDARELAEAVAAVLRRNDALDRVCIGAFGRRALRVMRALEPSVATSAAREEVRWALYRSWGRWPVRRPAYGGFQIPEIWGLTRVVSPRFVRDAHDAGAAVQVWTVDSEANARRLLDWGVDGLITDRPDLIVPLVAASARARS